MNSSNHIDELLSVFDSGKHEIEIFMDGVEKWFSRHPLLSQGAFPPVHSVKSRVKDREHLKSKLIRKLANGRTITKENFFSQVTDLAGVRVMHLHQDQFGLIHQEILKKKSANDWVFGEPPKAYTWDPESEKFFKRFSLEVEVKESFYTSVHYLIKPRFDSHLCCEVQIRTLFEEIWGEVDHALNYPVQSDNIACVEQLRVLTKVVGAGSRLVDSIFRTDKAGKIQ